MTAPHAQALAWSPVRPRLRPLRLVFAWLSSALALIVAAGIVPGAHVNGFFGAVLVAAIVAVLNAILLVFDVIACGLLILFVLLHAGRGGGLSDMFGGQMGGSMAGSTVVERNLDRITIVTALVFTFTTVLLALRV